MKRIYITFSGSAYHETTGAIVERAPRMGADQVVVYDDRWLMDQPLFRDPRFQWLYTHKGVGNPHGGRGFGWFSWKPYVIIDALSRCEPGDIVLYTDADTYPVAPFGVLYDECAKRDGMMLFSAVGCWNTMWTKRDCLIAMGMDEPRYRDCQHAAPAGFEQRARVGKYRGAPRPEIKQPPRFHAFDGLQNCGLFAALRIVCHLFLNALPDSDFGRVVPTCSKSWP